MFDARCGAFSGGAADATAQGDFTMTGTVAETRGFAAFLAKLPHKHKIVIAAGANRRHHPVFQTFHLLKKDIYPVNSAFFFTVLVSVELAPLLHSGQPRRDARCRVLRKLKRQVNDVE